MVSVRVECGCGMIMCSQVHGSVEAELGVRRRAGADMRAEASKRARASKRPGRQRRSGCGGVCRVGEWKSLSGCGMMGVIPGPWGSGDGAGRAGPDGGPGRAGRPAGGRASSEAGWGPGEQ